MSVNKEWVAPMIDVVSLGETANSNQPERPSDNLWFDYYNECDTCS